MKWSHTKMGQICLQLDRKWRPRVRVPWLSAPEMVPVFVPMLRLASGCLPDLDLGTHLHSEMRINHIREKCQIFWRCWFIFICKSLGFGDRHQKFMMSKTCWLSYSVLNGNVSGCSIRHNLKSPTIASLALHLVPKFVGHRQVMSLRRWVHTPS